MSRSSVGGGGSAWLPLLALAAWWASGCSAEPTGPAAATLQVELTTPADDDGAVLFTISGGPVDSLEPAGYTLYSSRPDPNTLRVIVVGNLGSGTVARLHIADQARAPQYSARVEQVAARSYAQRDPAKYSLSLAP